MLNRECGGIYELSRWGKGESREGRGVIMANPVAKFASVEGEMRGAGGVAGLFSVSSNGANWRFEDNCHIIIKVWVSTTWC